MNGDERNLYNSVLKFVNPNEREWNDFFTCFSSREMMKNEPLLVEGQISQKIAYISQGCFRMFYILNGEERCKDFQTEGQFTGSLYSFLSGKPALFNVSAIENSVILEISRDKLNHLFDTYKVWERFGRLYAEQLFLYKEQREASLLNESAFTRYSGFINTYSKWAQRIPQNTLLRTLG
ncbi:MAG: Crp/Fnr family transcriptional regulator [Bacteroidales bacterium]|nr:Crp/Fnr family transcriptional regulator [Bacteroidales bacterium]